MKKLAIGAGIVVGALIFVGLIGLASCVNFIDNYEVGYKYDKRSGKLEVLKKQGYVVTPPFLVSVHTVDLRPMQVCINANARVLNCKLVQFNPAGLEVFLAWHGRDTYNALQLEPILMSYAFDGTGKNYPFLTVLRELKPEDTPPAVR